MDRFTYAETNEEPIGECKCCHQDIYLWDDRYTVGEAMVHLECFTEFALKELQAIYIEGGTDGEL